jgi:hypothetical protein
VQFLVKLRHSPQCCGSDPRQRLGGLLVVAALVMLIAYRSWFEAAVPAAEAMVEQERPGLNGVPGSLVGGSIRASSPASSELHGRLEPTFHGWNPLVLMASPFALFVLRRRHLTLLLAASIVCYLLIIRFPAQIPFYLTYFNSVRLFATSSFSFISLRECASTFLPRGCRNTAMASRCRRPLSSRRVRCGQSVQQAMLAERPELADLLFLPLLVRMQQWPSGHGSRDRRRMTAGSMPLAALDAHNGCAVSSAAPTTELPQAHCGVSWAASPGPGRCWRRCRALMRASSPPPKALIRLVQNGAHR